MANFNELSQHYIKEIEHYLALSQALLQKGNKGGNLTGSLKTGGDYLETLVKSILKRFLPSHFRIVSGYIATPELMKTHADLPQFDVLIVDNKVPPLITMKDTDIEVNPIEGVCGIIEVKRTLNNKSFTDALDQIQKAVDIGLLKNNMQTNLVNTSNFGARHARPNPLFGVIGIQNQINSKYITKTIKNKQSLTDFVWSLNGLSILPILKKEGFDDILGYVPYGRDVCWENFTEDGYSGNFININASNELEMVDCFRKTIGFITLFMSCTFAHSRNEEKIFNYYF